MTTDTIRQQLHSYLEIADDKKVKAFYTLMKEDIEESGIEYTPKLKAELDSDYAAYKKDQTKMVSSAESKKRIGKILKTRKVK
jgi:hypothetical protein